MKRETKVARKRSAVKPASPAVAKSARPARADAPPWTFLTNHAHVLLCLAREPEILMRDVAVAVGITERAVQRIIADLERDGYLVRTHDGRRNRYEVRSDVPLRHPIEMHKSVATLLTLVLK